jgi:hypothetical protein
VRDWPPDIEFTTSWRAAELSFDRVPDAHTRFSGAPGHHEVKTSDRTNVSDPAVAGVRYRDVRLRYAWQNSLAFPGDK